MNTTNVTKQSTARGRLRFFAAVVMVLCLFFGPAFAQMAKLTASDAEPDDNFGFALSVSGTTMVVGAWQNDSLRANSGAAYVYEHSPTDGWQLATKLIPDNADFAGDEFGKSVAVDGDWLVVGAQFDDTVDNDRGAAYVFQRTPDADIPWTQVAKLTADDAAFRDFFGRTVAISGTLIVVGAPEDDDVGAQSGSAYVFAYDSATEAWGQIAKLTADDGEANDLFGSAVAIAGDTVLVGSPEHSHQDINNTGAAYVFSGADGNWRQVAKLTASDGDEKDRFGFSVTLNGERALVGAPYDDDNDNFGGSTYVFEGSGTTWTQITKLTADPELGNRFGYALALAGDHALIGAPGTDDNGKESGSAYVFGLDADGSTWRQIDRFVPGDGVLYDETGSAVAMSGEMAFIGAFQDDDQDQDDSGSVYIYQPGF